MRHSLWFVGAALLTAGLILLAGLLGPGQPAAPACAALARPLPQDLGFAEPDIRAAMQAALDRWTAAHPAAASFQLGGIWGQQDWAVGEVAVLPDPPGSSEGTIVLARRSGTAWQAFLAGDSAFSTVLSQGPAGFLPAGAVKWFLDQGTTGFSETHGLYYLPYTAGTSVRVTCLDCYAGHAPSIDFQSRGDRTLRAARAGTVVSWQDVGDLCCCRSACSACNSYIVLDHGDGEYSAYLHLASGSIPAEYRQTGAFVPQGAAIAMEGDVGYTCGSNRPETGCGAVAPDPDQKCGRHVHFEVRDAPFPQPGRQLRPRFQDVYDQTDPPTYFVEDGLTYVSGNVPVTPTVIPTTSPSPTPSPTATPVPTPAPGSCPPPQAPAGAYLFAEPNYCGFFGRFIAAAPNLGGTAVMTDGVRSLYLAGPYTATLFTAPSYSGTAEPFLAGDPDLGDNAVSTRTASLQVYLSSCPLISPGVVLYTAPDYGGACRYFSTSVPDLAAAGLDHAARSLRLAGPYSVTLYSAAGFSGTAETFFASTADLAGHPISGTVSSLRLGSLPCNPQADGVTLFSAPAYSGTCRTFVTSTVHLSATVGPTVTALLLRGPFRAILYSGPGYTGTAETFLLSDPDLRDNPISTTASALRVVPMPCRPWSEGVTLFAGRSFSGTCATLTADDPDLADEALAGAVWSVQVRGPYRATLFARPAYSGTAEVLDRSDADLGDNAILSATASVRVEVVTCTAGAGGVTLWAQPAYGGPCSTFRADDPDLAGDPIGAGNTFSLRVIGPYSVSLYARAAFSGTRTVILGDIPDLRGSAIGTGTVSLQVRALSETLRFWNDVRAFAFPIAVPTGTISYVQDLGPATTAPDDPLPPCALFGNRHTLWFRPLFSQTATLRVQVAGPYNVVLVLWLEEAGGLRPLSCVAGDGAVLEGLLPAGRQVLLEAATFGDAAGTYSLLVQRFQPWPIYLSIVLREPGE